MKNKRTLTTLVIIIVITSAIASSTGILSKEGPGVYEYETIRGKTVEIYGKGLYQHMTADVAIQGIAQDYVTLFLAIPFLLFALWRYRKGSLKGHFLLAGTLGYFFVTYLFYTVMGMYNYLFLLYLVLLCCSFFGLLILLISVNLPTLKSKFSLKTPAKLTGGFLIFNSIAIAYLWLEMIIPPLLDGTIYPDALNHFTTLIVQGLDLGLLLPICFVSGWLLLKKEPMGYLATTVYMVFLSFLMTALTAKIIAMANHGVNVIPVVFIIPVINLITITCALLMIKNIVRD
ncbi:MAG: hypothetical protein EA393_11600 [Bacteroidetes bacterium]|nr:MAG: hypothetical protein EA393_11600 [Bacteroidota bacterium]